MNHHAASAPRAKSISLRTAYMPVPSGAALFEQAAKAVWCLIFEENGFE